MKSRKQTGAASSSRRQFTKAVATTIVAAPLASKIAQAQKPTGTKEATAPPNPQTAQQQQKPSPVTEAYAEVARARFGDQLTPEQLEQVKKDLEANAQAAERLRAVKLKNEDEPDFIFHVE
jgi:secreted PhoX family phosphatase